MINRTYDEYQSEIAKKKYLLMQSQLSIQQNQAEIEQLQRNRGLPTTVLNPVGIKQIAGKLGGPNSVNLEEQGT